MPWCKLVCVLAGSVMCVALTGCASIMKGGHQNVSISSTPSDATATIYDRDGKAISAQKTPCVVNLDTGSGFFKSAQYRIVIAKPGYADSELRLEPKLSLWYMGGNFIFGGLVGYIIVDPLTGAMWWLDPEKVDVNLTPAGT